MRTALWTFTLVGLAGACGEAPAPVRLERRSAAIVNGRVEPGFPTVGAVVWQGDGFYQGAICTGTLIDPTRAGERPLEARWVLTAAHCVENADGAGWATPESLAFYLGLDANPDRAGGPPADGELVPVEAIFPHPQWRSDSNVEHDVALLRLSRAVVGTPTFRLNEGRLEGTEGDAVFYVGYGATEGWTSSGGGIRRSTTLFIQRVRPVSYYSGAADSGVCFGDSGGPGLLRAGDTWVVAGVNSALATSSDSEPCIGLAIHVRADAEFAWIRAVTGAATDCRTEPGLCQCDTACVPGGACDDLRCRPRLSCAEATTCVARCPDQLCWVECWLDVEEAGVAAFDALENCASDVCFDVFDALTDACAVEHCGAEIAACRAEGTPPPPPPPPPSGASCEATWRCILACGGFADSVCRERCAGTVPEDPDEADDFRGLEHCLAFECDGVRGGDFARCAWGRCEPQFQACVAPDDCALAGGDCGAEACVPLGEGRTVCVPSQRMMENANCGGFPVVEGADCADGLLCADGRCRPACGADRDCPAGRGCHDGLCGCPDADEDGVCAASDCDDHAAEVRPGAGEVCGNRVDDNCDGRTDERCEGASAPPPSPEPEAAPAPDAGSIECPDCEGDWEAPLDLSAGTCSAAPGRPGAALPGLALIMVGALRGVRRRAQR